MAKQLSEKDKEDLAGNLGTGGANKAAKALLDRKRKNQQALDEAMGVKPKDDFTEAVDMVKKKKSAARYDY